MARVTVEDCLEQVENRYELVHLSAKRSRQILRGSDAVVKCRNKAIVTSLREVAAGLIHRAEEDDEF